MKSQTTRQPVFTSGLALVIYVALVRVALYVIAAPNYGYFRDELYYLACGEHPAWGYVDQPPLIAWMAWLLQHTIGTSLYALRLLPMLGDVGAIFMTARLSRDMGGGRWAMFLSAIAVLVTPIFLGLSQLFTMNAFDPLLWTLLAWLVVKLVATGNQKLWLLIAVVIGVTLLNKYGVVFFVFGLLLGVILTPLRGSLVRPWFWLGAALATLIALPNFLWQRAWNYPFVQLIINVRRGPRDVMLPPLPYLWQQAQMIGFVAAVLVILGVWFLFSPLGRRYAVLGCGFAAVLGLMMILRGKFYYVAPVYPVVFAAGAVCFEQLTEQARWRWVRPAYALLMLAVGALIAPTIIPVLPVETFIAYSRRLGITQQKFENQQLSQLPQIFADMCGWEERVRIVAAYFHSLPSDEQKVTAIGAPDYGQAGAIDFFGPKYGLPKAISDNNNYWIWGPRNYTGQSIILLNENSPEKYATRCSSLTLVARPSDPYSRPDSNRPIYHCRGLKVDLQKLWPQLKGWN
jgi:Dolichyl-phosphate-mannose-protein mannosyltransferase